MIPRNSQKLYVSTEILQRGIRWNYSILCNERFFILYVKPLNPFSANFTKWSNTLKQFVGNLSTNCLSVFDHIMELALKGLNGMSFKKLTSNLSNNSLYLLFAILLSLIYFNYTFEYIIYLCNSWIHLVTYFSSVFIIYIFKFERLSDSAI